METMIKFSSNKEVVYNKVAKILLCYMSYRGLGQGITLVNYFISTSLFYVLHYVDHSVVLSPMFTLCVLE